MKKYILKYKHTINVLKKKKVTREKKLQKYNIEKSPTFMNTCTGMMNLNSTLVCITNVFENKIISSISRLEYHSSVPQGNTHGMYLFQY